MFSRETLDCQISHRLTSSVSGESLGTTAVPIHCTIMHTNKKKGEKKQLELKMSYQTQTTHSPLKSLTVSDGVAPSTATWRSMQRNHSILSLLGVMGVHSTFFVPGDLHLDIQTRPSEGPNKSFLWIWRKSVQWFLKILHSQTNKKTKS